LVNLPGESSSVVTVIDGYQMARNGRAGPALAAAGLGSFFAGCVGTLILAAFAAPLAALAVEPATPAGLPLEAVVAPPKALRRGERIFAGPKLFDFDDLSKAGVDVPGVAPVAAPPLIPRPPAIAKGPAKRGVLRVNPLEIKAVVLRGHGGGTGVA
jgi:hypothetical protein